MNRKHVLMVVLLSSCGGGGPPPAAPREAVAPRPAPTTAEGVAMERATVELLTSFPGQDRETVLAALPLVRTAPSPLDEGGTMVSFSTPLCFVPRGLERHEVCCGLSINIVDGGSVSYSSGCGSERLGVLPERVFEHLDGALRLHGDLDGYADLTEGLAHESQTLGFTIEERAAGYDVLAVPLSDPGYEIAFTVSRFGSGRISDIVVATIAEEPAYEEE